MTPAFEEFLKVNGLRVSIGYDRPAYVTAMLTEGAYEESLEVGDSELLAAVSAVSVHDAIEKLERLLRGKVLVSCATHTRYSAP